MMKVASFNVNSIRARLSIVLEWLEKEAPDVLCIQETKCPDTEFPQQAFENINYYSAFRGEKSYNGVAIISRAPIENVRIGFDENESEGTRLIAAVINNISIVNTYIPRAIIPFQNSFNKRWTGFGDCMSTLIETSSWTSRSCG